jgi:hypothetical protein
VPDRVAIARLRRSAAAALTAFAIALAGCAQPGTQAPKPEAAKLAVGTSDISTACGYAQELTAFGGPHAAGLGAQEAMATEGANRLAGVFAHSSTWIYQGESIGGLLNDSSSLLGECGLTGARQVLERALRHGH